MTYRKLIQQLAKIPAHELGKPVMLYEGCSGNWTELGWLECADVDIYHDDEEPGTERHTELSEFGPIKPVIKRGQHYFCHDH